MRMSAASCWCSLFAARAGAAASIIARHTATHPFTPIVRVWAVIGETRIASFCRDDEVRAAVLGPRGLVVSRVERKFFAVAHRTEAIGGDAERDQIRARGDGAPLAQRQIVLGRAALVAVAFDRHAPARILLQHGGVGVE